MADRRCETEMKKDNREMDATCGYHAHGRLACHVVQGGAGPVKTGMICVANPKIVFSKLEKLDNKTLNQVPTLRNACEFYSKLHLAEPGTKEKW